MVKLHVWRVLEPAQHQLQVHRPHHTLQVLETFFSIKFAGFKKAVT